MRRGRHVRVEVVALHEQAEIYNPYCGRLVQQASPIVWEQRVITIIEKPQYYAFLKRPIGERTYERRITVIQRGKRWEPVQKRVRISRRRRN
ncbi:MAG: hypothetical protein NZ959_11675 [Armatimonadetes bacterium]|nr:hypothetical protein [Armatimonadota bacterium]MDW8122980.1 hypothetical protein [Armatimonadota bacterium]